MENFVTEYLLPILGSFMALICSYIATIVAQWLSKKLGRNLTRDREEAIEKAISDAVWAAEEKGAQALKDGQIIKKATSEMKYRYVMDFIGNKFPKLSKADADLKVKGMIGKTPGLGSSACIPTCVSPPVVPVAVPGVQEEGQWRVVPDPVYDRQVVSP